MAQIHENVKEYYEKVLNSSKDLKTSACTMSKALHPTIKSIIKNIPSEILQKFYGCGLPIPFGCENCCILDLGCGTGRDCYIASKLVGPQGKVIGIDMLDSQLDVAKKYVSEFTKDYLKYPINNMTFTQGYIEDLSSIKNETVDIVISNCVVNLSPRKDLVLQEVFRVLKKGGEFYFSDVYSDRRMTKEAHDNKILYGECISGALYINDFLALSKKVGFFDPRELERKEIEISASENMLELKNLLGETKFYSITYRLFKLEALEPNCEDYGQIAVYLGTINEIPNSFLLDDHHKFEKNKPVLVCGNSASMLQETWLKPHFKIVGDRSVHYGVFPCGPKVDVVEVKEKKGGCCG